MDISIRPAERRALRRAASRGVAIAALALLGGWAPAQAAEAPRNTLTIDVGVDAQYETNVLRQTSFSGIGGNNHDNDFRITPSVDVSLHHVFGLSTVDLSGSAGYDFYTRDHFLNAARGSLSASDTTPVGSCHLSPSVSLSLSQTDVGDLGVAIGNSTFAQYYALAADCRRVIGVYPSVTGFFSAISNSDDTRKIFDVHTYGVSGGLGYVLPSVGDIQLSAGISKIERIGLRHATGVDDETTVTRAGVTLSRSVSSRLSASVTASYLHADPKLATVSSFTGIGYSGSVTYVPSPRVSVTGSFSRDVEGDGTFGSSYELANTFSLSGSLILTARSRIFANAALSRRNLRGEQVLPPPFLARDRDTTKQIGGGYEYNIRQKWFLSLSAAYTRRDSKNSFFDYSSTSLSLGIRRRL